MFKTISSRLIASIGCMVCVLIALAVTSQYITMRDNILQASKDRMLAELHQAEILFAEKGLTDGEIPRFLDRCGQRNRCRPRFP